jgi:hypothetical protein
VSARPAARPLKASVQSNTPCPRCAQIERELRLAVAAAAAAQASEAQARRQVTLLTSYLPDGPGPYPDGPGKPLRYRLVDALNATLKRSPRLHAAVKRAATLATRPGRR